MTDEQLEKVLKDIDLLDCLPILEGYIFYIKKYCFKSSCFCSKSACIFVFCGENRKNDDEFFVLLKIFRICFLDRLLNGLSLWFYHSRLNHKML